MGRLLNVLKTSLKLAAKVEIAALHIVSNAATYLLLVPHIEKPVLRAILANERFAMAQTRALGRRGIFDSVSVNNAAYDYLNANEKHMSAAKKVQTILKWNKEGTLNDLTALAQLQHTASHSRYGAEKARLSDQTWKTVLDWVNDKVSSSMKNMDGKFQEEFAGYTRLLFETAPVEPGESSNGLVIPPIRDGGRPLFILFNEKATNSGQHLVAFSHGATAPLPQILERLNTASYNIPQALNQEAITFLKNYQRKNPTPSL